MGDGIPITCTTTYQKWTGQPITWRVARIPCLQTWGVSNSINKDITKIKHLSPGGKELQCKYKNAKTLSL